MQIDRHYTTEIATNTGDPYGNMEFKNRVERDT